VTHRLAFDPAARETYLALRKQPDDPLYPLLRDVLTELATDPGSRRVRELRYRPDTWGFRVRASDARWLVLWRPSAADSDVIDIYYIGPEPGQA
jgi:hypothetical protein